jgi:hypothetical protein
MEIDNKYIYRTEIIRKKGKSNPTTTNPVISINESFDALVTSNSKLNLKILAPTRLFGNTDIGQIEFNLKSIIDDYYLKEQNTNDRSPSYRVQLPIKNSTSSRSNDISNPSTGMIEVIFYGSILNQRTTQTLSEPVNIYYNLKSNLFFVSRTHIHPLVMQH